MKTKAAILVELNRPLEVDEIEVPALRRGQVLVRVKASGVCGSQLGEIAGLKGPDRFLPHLLGHEAGGVVEAAGEGVTRVRPGDHVVMHWRKAGGLQAETPKYRRGAGAVNAGWVTTFQELAVVSENRLTPVPKEIPFDLAALYGCCVTTGFGVVENDARVRPKETVLVLGTGGIGLAETAAAKIAGAKTIIAVDLHETKLELAREFGATHTVPAARGNVPETVAEILAGRHLDVVLENTGRRELIESGYEMCGPKGRTVLVGVPDVKDKARIDTLPLHFGKVLTGSYGGGIKPDEAIPRIMKAAAGAGIDFLKMADGCYRLGEVNRALEDLAGGRAVRPMIVTD